MIVFGFILLILIYLLPDMGLKAQIVVALLPLSMLFTIIYIGYTEYKKRGINKRDKHLNIKEIPTIRTPLELGYLLNAKITHKLLGVTIMELVRKRVLLLRYDRNKHDYIFLYNSNGDEVTDAEQALLKWMLNKIGNGECFSLSLLKKDAYLNSAYFVSCYHDWQTIASFEGTKPNFFETSQRSTDKVIGYIILSIVLALLGISVHVSPYLTVSSLIFSLFLIIYINSFYLRTKSGNDEYSRWISLGHSIKKGNAFHAITDLVLLKRGVIYALLLRIEASKALIKIPEIESHKIEEDEFLVYVKNGIIDELCSKMNKLVPLALGISFFFARNKGSRAMLKYKNNKEV